VGFQNLRDVVLIGLEHLKCSLIRATDDEFDTNEPLFSLEYRI
jgi:hypothetical protein